MPTGKKTALDEMIAKRNAEMSKKSAKELYALSSGTLVPKVFTELAEPPIPSLLQ
jgi:hypothetical protein